MPVKEQLQAKIMLKYIYTKLGYIVPFITISIFLLMYVLFNGLNKDWTYYNENLFPRILTSILTGVVIWYVGRRLNEEEDNGGKKKKVKIEKLHTFFTVKMEYWGPIIAIISIIGYFK